jgi:hypothetical protein
MNTWSGRVFNVAAMAALLSLSLLVMPGTARAINHFFVDNGDGTVTDPTGQMWTKRADLFPLSDWHAAINACESLSISGISGWRLPVAGELLNLCSILRGGHPFVGFFFPYHWSDPWGLSMEREHVLAVNMHDCRHSLISISSILGVWCVRDRN